LGSKKYYKVRGELRRSLLDNKILAEDIAIRRGRADVVLLRELKLLKIIPTLTQYDIAGYETLYILENSKLEANIRGAAPRLYKLLASLCINRKNYTPLTFTRILAIISNIYYTRG